MCYVTGWIEKREVGWSTVDRKGYGRGYGSLGVLDLPVSSQHLLVQSAVEKSEKWMIN